jgi:glycosyltransferase involved in cell wall biosynthesis
LRRRLHSGVQRSETIAASSIGVRRSSTASIVVDDGSSDETAERARAAGADVSCTARTAAKGTRCAAGLARVLRRRFTHVLLLDARHAAPARRKRPLLAEASRSGAEVVLGERRFERGRDAGHAYHANRIGSRVLSWFVGVAGAGYAVRVRVSSR